MQCPVRSSVSHQPACHGPGQHPAAAQKPAIALCTSNVRMVVPHGHGLPANGLTPGASPILGCRPDTTPADPLCGSRGLAFIMPRMRGSDFQALADISVTLAGAGEGLQQPHSGARACARREVEVGARQQCPERARDSTRDGRQVAVQSQAGNPLVSPQLGTRSPRISPRMSPQLRTRSPCPPERTPMVLVRQGSVHSQCRAAIAKDDSAWQWPCSRPCSPSAAKVQFTTSPRPDARSVDVSGAGLPLTARAVSQHGPADSATFDAATCSPVLWVSTTEAMRQASAQASVHIDSQCAVQVAGTDTKFEAPAVRVPTPLSVRLPVMSSSEARANFVRRLSSAPPLKHALPDALHLAPRAPKVSSPQPTPPRAHRSIADAVAHFETWPGVPTLPGGESKLDTSLSSIATTSGACSQEATMRSPRILACRRESSPATPRNATIVSSPQHTGAASPRLISVQPTPPPPVSPGRPPESSLCDTTWPSGLEGLSSHEMKKAEIAYKLQHVVYTPRLSSRDAHSPPRCMCVREVSTPMSSLREVSTPMSARASTPGQRPWTPAASRHASREGGESSRSSKSASASLLKSQLDETSQNARQTVSARVRKTVPGRLPVRAKDGEGFSDACIRLQQKLQTAREDKSCVISV